MRCGSPVTGKALLVLATLVVTGVTGVLGLPRAAPASAGASCVAVLVDSRQLGGSVRTGCAQGDPSNGFQALSKAGFGYTPRPRDGLVCQIDARPACADTTSAAYWSYWYRAPGSRGWVYANQGAGTHDPRPGSTEAWVWQDGGRTPPPDTAASAICPQLGAPPKSSPAPSTAAPEPTRGSGGGGPTATRVAARTRPSRTKATAAQTSSPSTVATSAVSAAAAAAVTDATGPPTPAPPTPDRPTAAPSRSVVPLDAKPAGAGGALSGGTGVALGGLLVLVVGGAAVRRARRSHTS